MEKGVFESYMRRAKFLANGEYVTGYQRGLRRHFHGVSFGTDAEHTQWLSLQADETRAEQGRGYLDGFNGKEPATTL